MVKVVIHVGKGAKFEVKKVNMLAKIYAAETPVLEMGNTFRNKLNLLRVNKYNKLLSLDMRKSSFRTLKECFSNSGSVSDRA